MSWTSARAAVTRSAALAVLALLFEGCATTRGIPMDFDPGRAGLLVEPTPTATVVVGPSGKPSASTIGGLTGTGVGFAAGSALCLGTGPLFALCMLSLVPTTTAIGAVSGGVAGAVAESSGVPPPGAQETLLRSSAADGYSSLLTGYVQGEVRSAMRVAMPRVDGDGVALAGETASTATHEWLAVI